jgi:ATP citrate (pro-S)-lyase
MKINILKGIVKALVEYSSQLIEFNVSIYVRRAGPNYQEGLRVMRELSGTLGVPIHVYGPETHMTAIVSMALGKCDILKPSKPIQTTANFLLPTNSNYNEFSDRSRSSSVTNTTNQSQDNGNKMSKVCLIS